MKKLLVVLAFLFVLCSCSKPGTVDHKPYSISTSRWYDLKIGEKLKVGSWDYVLRVPGGWILRLDEGSWGGVACFIPYSEEGR